jgi:2-polyprenyl-6-methoxyphenol hydroxylase-like FAD-dependent oxidoreductase
MPASGRQRHAVVIGGSIAGLTAARILADYFDHVTLLERDRYPQQVEFRSGVPQGRHLHLLLLRGRALFEQLFPAIGEDFAAAGANDIDLFGDALWLMPGGWLPRTRSAFHTFMATRPLFDTVIRRRLAALAKVTTRDQVEVTGLLASADRSVVTGVRLRQRGGEGAESTLEADLVVDCSGRNSRLPKWLEELGYAPPRDTIVNSFVGYASRIYAIPDGWDADWKALFFTGDPLRLPHNGGLFPVEGNRWIVTLVGSAKQYAPTDEDGFMAFARSLRSPLMADAIAQAEPLGPIYGYQRTENRLRHYEKLSRLPGQLLALGDAVCAFNPIYGQGMSTAALGSLVLERCLRADPDSSRPGWSARFYRQLARSNSPVWLMSTGEDFRYPTTVGGSRTPLTRALHWYLDQVNAASNAQFSVAESLVEVVHLLKPPISLFRPQIARHVLGHAIRRQPVEPLPARPSWLNRT